MLEVDALMAEEVLNRPVASRPRRADVGDEARLLWQREFAQEALVGERCSVDCWQRQEMRRVSFGLWHQCWLGSRAHAVGSAHDSFCSLPEWCHVANISTVVEAADAHTGLSAAISRAQRLSQGFA